MKPAKDRRVQYTKMVLRESLLDLLKSKTLNEISISELCSAADVNRNTFYNHYRFPKEIIREMEDEIFNELMNSIKDKNNTDDVILAACRLLEKDKRMSELIFFKTDESNVLTKVLASFRDKHWKKQNGLKIPDKEAHSFVNEFNEKGTIGVIRYWILNGFKEPAETVALFISGNVKKVSE